MNLSRTLEKFTKGKENLDKLLGMQRMSLDKGGIGFESKSKNLVMLPNFLLCHFILVIIAAKLVIWFENVHSRKG